MKTKFVERLKKSQKAVEVAADWWRSRDYIVDVPETKIRPTRDQWKEYADSGDFYVTSISGGLTRRMEVKGLSCNFTDRTDWPFGSNFIVCAKHSWDNAEPKPFLYMYLNPAMTHAAVVFGYHHKSWTIKSIPDRDRPYAQDCYMSDINNVNWIDLTREPGFH